MNKLDVKALIHEACDILECNVSSWSCHAILRAGRRYDCTDDESSAQAREVTERYAAFYEKSYTEPWGFDYDGPELRRSARIIALLLFLEAEGDL